MPEIVKRLVDAGYEKLSEGPENVRHFVSELKLPKDALALILAQMDETKNGIYRAVAKEVRDFLDHTNFSDELANVLTKLSFEIKTEVRFVPNDKGVVLGLISTKTPELEALEALRRRVDEAARYIDRDRLAISPQCGFASTAAGNPLSEIDQRAKLALVVRAAAQMWD